MSKAFTKEPDSSLDDDDDEREEAPRPKGANHITRAGYDALSRELSHLWTVDRRTHPADL